MSMRPLVYVETSVISYMAARPSSNPLLAAQQEFTRTWWARAEQSFELCISPSVIAELTRGDESAAAARMAAIANLAVLHPRGAESELVAAYLAQLNLPGRAVADAEHIAAASVAGADYLVTWNCKHIANATIRKKVFEINSAHGVSMPIICTPEELPYDPEY